MTLLQIISRVSLIVIAVAILTAFALFLIPLMREANGLRAEKAALEEEIARKEERIRELKSFQERFVTDPEFVEQTARQMGLVAPGETIYEFNNQPDNQPH
ncbi:MAG: FtsB family cell division protein [Kiritimatiellia bacterium]